MQYNIQVILHQRGDKLARRVKSYDGQHETLPIKDTRQLQEFMYNLLRKKDRAKTPIKKYQADRNWMMCLLGFNTAAAESIRCQKGIYTYKRKQNG